MLGVTAIANGVSVGQGFALELLFTFMLVFFVVSITDPKKNPEPYGTTLGIGLLIVVSHVCIVSNYYNIKHKKIQTLSAPQLLGEKIRVQSFFTFVLLYLN